MLSEGLGQTEMNENHILYPGIAGGFEDAELEDLFTQGDYVTLFNQTFEKKLKSSTLGKDGQISGRIEVKHGETLNKLAVAKYLLRNQHSVSLTKTSLDRFESLIKEINSKL